VYCQEKEEIKSKKGYSFASFGDLLLGGKKVYISTGPVNLGEVHGKGSCRRGKGEVD